MTGQNNGRYEMPRPFVKWVGGKGQLLTQMAARQPEHFRVYHAPFLGGGAYYFYLIRMGLIRPRMAMLSDANWELIKTYCAIRDHVDDVISYLEQQPNKEDYYYKVRNLDPTQLSPVTIAARFIYLNRTCFNGLVRYNAKGKFNSPYGHYTNPTICNKPNLVACSQALKSAYIAVWDFEAVLDNARSGDFVYLDPPYFPKSRTANFTGYIANGFGVDDQRRLAAVVHELSSKGVYVMASNHDVPQVYKLYQGLTIERVTAIRSVNSKVNNRGAIGEVLITNYY